jgi:hypothetical protein
LVQVAWFRRSCLVGLPGRCSAGSSRALSWRAWCP